MEDDVSMRMKKSGSGCVLKVFFLFAGSYGSRKVENRILLEEGRMVKGSATWFLGREKVLGVY